MSFLAPKISFPKSGEKNMNKLKAAFNVRSDEEVIQRALELALIAVNHKGESDIVLIADANGTRGERVKMSAD